MELSANVGSDRSWVWSVAADFADGVSQSELLAIRFANSESKTFFDSISFFFFQFHENYSNLDAQLFKEAFEKARTENSQDEKKEEKKEEKTEEKKEEKKEEEKKE